MVEVKHLSAEAAAELLLLTEGHFADLKGRELTPAKFTKTVSAFANSSGGEIFVGIEEFEGLAGKERSWEGFDDQEAANGFFQVLHDIDPFSRDFSCEFLISDIAAGYVLHVTIAKTQHIVEATDGRVYVRSNAQSLPVKDEALERLKYEKGIKSYEDEIVPIDPAEITNSQTIIEFLLDTVPTGEPAIWLQKQFVLTGDRPSVAGILLYADNPQAVLPKRSAIKILRYQTKKDAERDFLAFDPETIEGPVYNLIYDAVDRVKEIIEGMEKVGAKGMERISYPEEALHELVTNAVLHRDYSVAADVQVRIFDNRVEIESPGKLPGHVTVENIARTQFARNPKVVRLVNKFKNPPNKDVGEGINTAVQAMEKIRLKKPVFEETQTSVVVVLKHESLASPEQMVLEYLKDHEEITNQIARDLTGIKSENTMKNVFYRLRENGELEQSPKIKGKKQSWRKSKA